MHNTVKCVEEHHLTLLHLCALIFYIDESFSVHQSDQVLESEHQESTG